MVTRVAFAFVLFVSSTAGNEDSLQVCDEVECQLEGRQALLQVGRRSTISSLTQVRTCESGIGQDATLDEAGYSSVRHEDCAEEMLVFVRRLIEGGKICDYSQEACRRYAQAQGLQLGGAGADFAGDYQTKGCYTYSSGTYAGRAYYGLNNGGDITSEGQLGALSSPDQTRVSTCAGPICVEGALAGLIPYFDCDDDHMSYADLLAALLAAADPNGQCPWIGAPTCLPFDTEICGSFPGATLPPCIHTQPPSTTPATVATTTTTTAATAATTAARTTTKATRRQLQTTATTTTRTRTTTTKRITTSTTQTLHCKSWCQKNANDGVNTWAEMCTWPKFCAGCDACGATTATTTTKSGATTTKRGATTTKVGATTTPSSTGECKWPANTKSYSLITKGFAKIGAHDVYTPIVVGGELSDGSPNENTAIASHKAGKSYAHSIKAGGKWVFKGGNKKGSDGFKLSDMFKWSDFEWLARNLKDHNGNGYKIKVFNKGGLYTTYDIQPGGQGEDNGKSLMVFTTSETITLKKTNDGRQFGPTVLAPFAKVVLATGAGFVDGSVIAKEFGSSDGSLQMHGDFFKGTLKCK